MTEVETWHAIRAWAKATRTTTPLPKKHRWYVERCCRQHENWWVSDNFSHILDSTHKDKTHALRRARYLNDKREKQRVKHATVRNP